MKMPKTMKAKTRTEEERREEKKKERKRERESERSAFVFIYLCSCGIGEEGERQHASQRECMEHFSSFVFSAPFLTFDSFLLFFFLC